MLRGADNRDAEGVEEEGYGKGVSPSQPTRGSREHRKLPQRDPGRSLKLEKKTHVIAINL